MSILVLFTYINFKVPDNERQYIQDQRAKVGSKGKFKMVEVDKKDRPRLLPNIPGLPPPLSASLTVAEAVQQELQTDESLSCEETLSLSTSIDVTPQVSSGVPVFLYYEFLL